MSPETEPLLEREFLQQLEQLSLRWGKSLVGLVGGHNLSRHAGPGQEFLDHRNFHHGDDLRSVNWRAYMRFERLFLKMFHIESRAPIRLLLDVSSSMQTSSSKSRYAKQFAAALVYVGLIRSDNILIHPFSDRLHEPVLATGGRHRFHPVEQFLRSLQGSGKTDFLAVAREYLERYGQRALTIVISDFLTEVDCLRPLQFLADWGHELQLVQVWSPEDRVPAFAGEADIVDAETGVSIRVTFGDEQRKLYTQAFDEYADELKNLANRYAGQYLGLSSDIALRETVLHLLSSDFLSQ